MKIRLVLASFTDWRLYFDSSVPARDIANDAPASRFLTIGIPRRIPLESR
jgi:hypothetical protein